MPFLQKGQDPWETGPDRERESLENPLDTLREWNEKRKADVAAKKAAQAAEPPEKCPWCRGDMERGYLASGRSRLIWAPGRMSASPPKETRARLLQVDNEGWPFRYKTAWYCAACEKMTINAAGLLSPLETPWWPTPEDEAAGSSVGEVDL